MMNFNIEFQSLRMQMGFSKKVRVSDAEVKELEKLRQEGKNMPEGITWYMEGGQSVYRRTEQSEVSFEDKMEYLMMKQTSCINIIKNCVVFITVIVAITVGGFLLALF